MSTVNLLAAATRLFHHALDVELEMGQDHWSSYQRAQFTDILVGYMRYMPHANYFTSSDPHHDISRCIFGHIFLYIRTIYLTYILTFYLAYILAFYLTFYLAFFLALFHLAFYLSFYHRRSRVEVQRCRCPLGSGGPRGGEEEERRGREEKARRDMLKI